jgi:hypothetical protein
VCIHYLYCIHSPTLFPTTFLLPPAPYPQHNFKMLNLIGYFLNWDFIFYFTIKIESEEVETWCKWWSTCLACVKAWVQTLVPWKKRIFFWFIVCQKQDYKIIRL